MKGPVSWMAHNHVAANLLMMIFIVGGSVVATLAQFTDAAPVHAMVDALDWLWTGATVGGH